MISTALQSMELFQIYTALTDIGPDTIFNFKASQLLDWTL